MHKKTFYVIGIMSGTSLDGVDIALCKFEKDINWKYQIIHAKTYSYDKNWYQKLSEANNLSAFDFIKLHKEYGKYLGQLTNKFIKEHRISNVDLISSHGHTIFHSPDEHLNFQIGDGAFIAAETQITTVSDFRTLDIALGGQGAPLVPIGDELLFSNYNFCLNIGGFSNISFKENQHRIAFDICPSNIILNYLANKLNIPFDKDGKVSRTGKIQYHLLEKLNNLDYYKKTPPKSLGKEWFEKFFLPIIDSYSCSVEDKLATCIEHIATQIVKYTKNGTLLITGGGAYNKHLIEKITHYSNCEIIIPEKFIVEFKESLIFAFLGLLRWMKETNVLKSVTGAKQNSVSGIIHIMKKATFF